MTHTLHDDLEHGLRELFERQHDAVEPSDAAWDPAATVAVVDLDPQRTVSRRRLGVAAIAVAAATVAIGLGVVYAIGTGSSAGKPQPVGRSGPANSTPTTIGCVDGITATVACNAAVRWETPEVHLEGSRFSITTTGATGTHDFVGDDPHLALNSDPGDATFQTLELKWRERGIPQRWYIYFHSDGKDWWSFQMRTLDGSPNGDWVTFDGERFRTPLGSAWSGDLDVTGTNHGVTSRLRIHIAKLQAFLATAGQPSSS